VRLLGGFAVEVSGRRLEDRAWRLRRAKTLIKLLALTPERRLHREQLEDLLWPDGGPAANSLHQVLYTARRALATAGVDATATLALRDGVVELSRDSLRVDVDDFERAAAKAREAPAAEAYETALGLYGGELLPEDRYEDWPAARRESLRETYLALVVELGELLAARGDTSAAVEKLQRAVVEDPLHEPAHRALMGIFAADGRRQQALAQYGQLRQTLRIQLAADPDPETAQLYRQILAAQHEPPAVGVSPSPQPAITDQQPAAATATGAPGAESPRVAGALPHQLTSFVGRERELSQLEDALARGRLVTLTGPGGCGKTRLALQLAERLTAARGVEVCLVELAPVSDPALVVEETATALGVQLRSERDPVQVLAGQIGGRSVLLVLDNCEHLLDAAVHLADGLLRACPELRVLTTSRERLRIAGEVAWRVPPLSLPDRGAHGDAASVAGFEAVALFTQRAAEADPAFSLGEDNAAAITDICTRLDGMPLALELAAARVGGLSPLEIADRLGDALGLLRGGSRAGLTRQQTLRATLAWSHDLLSEPEQALYRRLGVFAGSFGLPAVEGICVDDEVPAEEVLVLLLGLIEKSLVQPETGHGARTRYRLLETIRQDTREHLQSAGETGSFEAAHRAWYMTLAEAADRDRDPGVGLMWPAERVEEEHDDLRLALASAIRHEPAAGLLLARSLWWFWMARGYFAEGSRWLEAALAGTAETDPTRPLALVALGAIDVRRQGAARSIALGEEALSIVRLGGDRGAEARALERLGMMALGGFDWPLADRAFAEALDLALEDGDEPVRVASRQAQGVLAGIRGETSRARELLGESLDGLERLDDERGPLFWAVHVSPVVIPVGPRGALRYFFEDTFCLFRAVRSKAGGAYIRVNVAETFRTDGDCASAQEHLGRALATFRELGDEQGAGVALNALGNLARQDGEVDAGREHFEQALAIRRAAGDPRETATTLTGLAMLEQLAGRTTEGQRLAEQASAIYARTEDAPGRQLLPLTLGEAELDLGDPAKAVVLLEQGAELSRERGFDHSIGWGLTGLAEALIAVAEPARAREALSEAMPAFERSGDMRAVSYAQALIDGLGTAAEGR
jgi:predicted ATPase/DNA-binding SARP family transcriptional activator